MVVIAMSHVQNTVVRQPMAIAATAAMTTAIQPAHMHACAMNRIWKNAPMVVFMSVQTHVLHTARVRVKNTVHAVSTILSKAKNRMPNPQQRDLLLTPLAQQVKQNRVRIANRVFNIGCV